MYGIDTWGEIALNNAVQIICGGLYVGFLVQGSLESIDTIAVYGGVIALALWTILGSVQHGVVPKLVLS